MQAFRNRGSIGAILDEYEKAIKELKFIIEDLSKSELAAVVDAQTADEDCKSIQTILTHVIRSGYTYAIIIRNKLGEDMSFFERQTLPTIAAYSEALDKMFEFNEQLFLDFPELSMESFQKNDLITSSWETLYDVEQLFEHAIVHILRHRRQIEKFKLTLRKTNP